MTNSKDFNIHNNSVDETSSENKCSVPLEPTCNYGICISIHP